MISGHQHTYYTDMTQDSGPEKSRLRLLVPQGSRVYLECEFREIEKRNKIKADGGKFDKILRAWYYPTREIFEKARVKTMMYPGGFYNELTVCYHCRCPTYNRITRECVICNMDNDSDSE